LRFPEKASFSEASSPFFGLKSERKILLFFPAIRFFSPRNREIESCGGPFTGCCSFLLWAAVAQACLLLNLPAMITALILCAYPYVVTGFWHPDGFMDVTDAVKSRRDLERRREILKGSHVGSKPPSRFVRRDKRKVRRKETEAFLRGTQFPKSPKKRFPLRNALRVEKKVRLFLIFYCFISLSIAKELSIRRSAVPSPDREV